jgi:cyclopropane fatty-acyl-phospholipid synthase-like methyltransferase
MVFKKFYRRLFYLLAYFHHPPWDTGISPPELMEYIRTHPPGRAIDLGCGTGTNVITLAHHGWTVTGIDFVPGAIRTANRKIKKNNVKARVQVGDVTQLIIGSNRYDLALDIGCYHHLDLAAKQMYEKNLANILCAGGNYLLYGFIKAPETTFGISDADLARLQTFLRLDNRQDGKDRERNSSWLAFTKLPETS